MPPLDLALDGLRVHGLAHILRGGDLHHLHQAELGVNVDHRPVGGERVLHVGLALAGLRVQRMGGPVPPGHRLLGGLVEQLGQAGRGPARPGACPPKRSCARRSSCARTAWHAARTAPPVT